MLTRLVGVVVGAVEGVVVGRLRWVTLILLLLVVDEDAAVWC